MALSAARLPAPPNGQRDVLPLAGSEYGGKNSSLSPRAGSPESRPHPDAHRPHHRFAIGEDGGKKGGCYGYDAGKKIGGRKRFTAVDTQGLIVALDVLPADTPERAGAQQVLPQACTQSPNAQVVWADGGYDGAKFTAWCQQTLGLLLLVVNKPLGIKTFQVLPRRWVVERTFGWLGKFRRLARDYEVNPKNSRDWIFLAMINLMINRLARE